MTFPKVFWVFSIYVISPIFYNLENEIKIKQNKYLLVVLGIGERSSIADFEEGNSLEL